MIFSRIPLIPQTDLICRGSDGLVRHPVEVGHIRRGGVPAIFPQTDLICRGSDGLVRHPVEVLHHRRGGAPVILSLIFTVLGESDYHKHIVKWSPASWNAVKINENGKKIKIFAPVGRPVARLVARGRPRAGMLSKTSVWGLSLELLEREREREKQKCWRRSLSLSLSRGCLAKKQHFP